MARSKQKSSAMRLTRLRGGSFRCPCILSFPNLHRAVSGKDGETPKYTMAAIIPKDIDLSELEDAIEDCIKEKWADKRPKKLQLPIRDGEEYEEKEGYDDTVVFFNARNTRRPYVKDMAGENIEDPEETYPGCRGFVIFDPYAYDTDGNRGVGMSLKGFVKAAEGERLGGAAPNDPDEDMEDLDEDFDPEEFSF